MPFAVYHNYLYDAKRKSGRVLLCMKDTQAEAVRFVDAQYSSRLAQDKDWVTVHDEQDNVVYRLEVEYMPQFEAQPGKVWHFRSKSNPKNSYTAQVNTTGIVSCNCRAWAMGWKRNPHPLGSQPYRHCAHVDEVIARHGLNVEVSGQYLMLVDPRIAAAKAKFAKVEGTGPQATFARLVQEYEYAIAVMTALEPGDMYQAAPAVEMAKFKCEAYLLLLEQHGIDGSAAFMAAEAKLQQAIGRA